MQDIQPTVDSVIALKPEPDAADLRTQLLASIEAGGPVRVDASAVRILSTACAQVLLAADRSAAAGDRPFRVVDASEAFTDALGTLGLRVDLQRWQGRS